MMFLHLTFALLCRALFRAKLVASRKRALWFHKALWSIDREWQLAEDAAHGAVNGLNDLVDVVLARDEGRGEA